MSVSSKELRVRASSILENVRKGDEVVITMRGRSIAIIKPLKKIKKTFEPIGFGIWKKRKDMTDVKKWLDDRRKERFHR